MTMLDIEQFKMPPRSAFTIRSRYSACSINCNMANLFNHLKQKHPEEYADRKTVRGPNVSA